MPQRKIPTISGAKEFMDDMNRLIPETKDKFNKSYFEQWVKDFENYKDIYSKILTTTNKLNDYYSFRISYTLKTPVWREILCLGSDNLDELAEELIYSMGWDNDHLHQFLPRTINGEFLGFYGRLSIKLEYPDDDEDWPSYKTQQIRIADIDWAKYPKWNFVFDFGDNHTFHIEHKGKLTKKEAYAKWYFEETPIVIDQRGVGPIQYPNWEEIESRADSLHLNRG